MAGPYQGAYTLNFSSESRRLFIDLSTLLGWSGPVVGMVRVEMELARYALTHRPDVEFIFFDKQKRVYRGIHPGFVSHMVNGQQVTRLAGFPTAPLFQSGENYSAPADFVWRKLMATRFWGAIRRLRPRGFGASAAYKTSSAVIDDFPRLAPDAVILAPGAEWDDKDAAAVADQKRRHGHRLVMVCHDVIPIRFPEFFTVRLASTFLSYFRSAAGFVDRFVCVSRCTAQDLENFIGREGLTRPDIRVEPLGARVTDPAKPLPPLPQGLVANRFALFVSTIEPRKNHRLLCRVWLRLIESGVIAGTEFKLVFVGRRGWQMDELHAEIAANRRLAGSIVYLPDVSDDVLGKLYREAAFCVYPSVYEGFGLPVWEALAHGRAVIASNGGAIPEAMGEFGVCLDPTDDDVWYETLARWITDPQIVAEHEMKVRLGFRQRTWNEVAAHYFQQALDPFPLPVSTIPIGNR